MTAGVFNGWEELIAALAGAVAAGVLSLLDRRSERKRKRHATLTAITSEVAAICSLIRENGYHNDLTELASQVHEGRWQDEVQTIDITMNYMFVYESLAGSLGELEASHVEPIVEFYQRARTFIDSTRPNGTLSEGGTPEEREAHVILASQNLNRLIELGSRIVKFVEH